VYISNLFSLLSSIIYLDHPLSSCLLICPTFAEDVIATTTTVEAARRAHEERECQEAADLKTQQEKEHAY
jgi:hypothetical protein